MLLEGMTVSNWAKIEEWIRRFAEELSYASVSLVKDKRETRFRRLRFSEHEDTDEQTDFYNEADGEPHEALLRWLAEQINAECAGAPSTRLRLRCYRGGGEGALKSFYLMVQHHIELPARPPAEAVVEQLALNRSAREEGEMSRFHSVVLDAAERVSQMSLALVQGVTQTAEGSMQQLYDELANNRRQVNALVEKVTRLKIDVAETRATKLAEDAQRSAQDERSKMAHQLGQEALGQLGQLVQLMAIKQQLQGQGTSEPDPQLRALMGVLQKHPELEQALRDPAVTQILNDPDNATWLANTLNEAAAQVRNNAAQSTPEGTSDGPPPSAP